MNGPGRKRPRRGEKVDSRAAADGQPHPPLTPPPIRVPCPSELGLSSGRSAELEVRIQQILYRWRPLTEDPQNLARDLYALADWLLDGDDPPEGQVLIIDV